MDSKLNLVMCGDHPSFTKSKLNLKDEHALLGNKSASRITPTISRLEKESSSEHILSLDNKDFFNAAVDSLHWPPYLLVVWIILLVLTHFLHCALSITSSALPRVKVLRDLSRSYMYSSRGSRPRAVLSGFVCGALYCAHAALGTADTVLRWAVQGDQ